MSWAISSVIDISIARHAHTKNIKRKTNFTTVPVHQPCDKKKSNPISGSKNHPITVYSMLRSPPIFQSWYRKSFDGGWTLHFMTVPPVVCVLHEPRCDANQENVMMANLERPTSFLLWQASSQHNLYKDTCLHNIVALPTQCIGRCYAIRLHNIKETN